LIVMSSAIAEQPTGGAGTAVIGQGCRRRPRPLSGRRESPGQTKVSHRLGQGGFFWPAKRVFRHRSSPQGGALVTFCRRLADNFRQAWQVPLDFAADQATINPDERMNHSGKCR